MLDDEAVIKATLAQVESNHQRSNKQQLHFSPKILDQWSKAKTAEADDEVVKKIDLDKIDLVEKMSQITQVAQDITDLNANQLHFQEKLATYTPKKQEEQSEEQRRIKEAILQV